MNELFMPSKTIGLKETIAKGIGFKEAKRLFVGVLILIPIAVILIFIFNADYILVLGGGIVVVGCIYLCVQKAALNISLYDFIVQIIKFEKSQKRYLYKRLNDWSFINDKTIK